MPALPDNLTTTENEIIAAVSAGRAWENPNGRPTSKELAKKDFVAKMPEVRAEVIRALCLGARLNDAKPDPAGVQISGVRIVGEMDLSFATVDVPLRLYSCHFADELVFRLAKLAFLELSGSRLKQGLKADGANIANNLFCRDNFNANGEICLSGAEIGGYADFDAASLNNFEMCALSAQSVRIAKGIYFGDSSSIVGDADFAGASIGNIFVWKPVQWTGRLRLAHAHAGQWADNWRGDGWKNGDKPIDGKPRLDIDAFAYDALADDDTDKDAASRIAWVRKSMEERSEEYKFVPGPYETLVKVLRAAGDEDGANEVAYAKRADRAKARQHKLGHRISNVIFGAVVGYGYKPWRGLMWLISLLVTGFCVFSLAGPMAEGGTGVIKPAVPIVFDNNLARCEADLWHPGMACETFIDKIEPLETHRIYYFLPIEYTPFSPFWYALDTLIPLVDLGQESAWSPSPIDQSVFKDPWGWAVLIYLYAHIIMGWVLTTLTVVALTGVIKKE